MTEHIPIAYGENVWRLLRTDRDGATREEVLQMVGPAMHFMLHEAGEQFADLDPWQIVVQTGPDGAEMPEWRIGAARPIVAVEAQRGAMPPFPMPEAARVLWSRAQYTGPGLPGVKFKKEPWWILVRFWWRQDEAEITVPGYRVNAIGWHESDPEDLQQADWVLDKAIVPAAQQVDPGSQTWGDEMVPRGLDSLKTAGKWAGSIVAVGALVALAVYLGPAIIARGRKAGVQP